MSEIIFNKQLLKGNARREMLNGQEHLVVPAIAMREGVMNGMLYTKEKIKANAQTWNGVPIPVGHPQINGEHVSANSPDIEASFNIGKVYNSRYEDGELKVEFWINLAKAEELGHNNLIATLESGDTIDVSTGLFSTQKEEAGIFNNSSYEFVAQDIRPDHIAILPDEKGACSVADGCGTGAFVANHESCCGSCSDGGECDSKKTGKLSFNMEKVNKLIKKTMEQFSQSLDTLVSNESMSLETETEATAVVLNTKQTMDKTQLIEKIIANKASKFGSEDKETLEGFEVNTLQKLSDSCPTEQPAVVVEKPATGDVVMVNKDELAEFEAFKANAKKDKDDLVSKVSEASGIEVSELESLSVNSLKALEVKFSKVEEKEVKADYSGAGGAGVQTNSQSASGFGCQDIEIKK